MHIQKINKYTKMQTKRHIFVISLSFIFYHKIFKKYQITLLSLMLYNICYLSIQIQQLRKCHFFFVCCNNFNIIKLQVFILSYKKLVLPIYRNKADQYYSRTQNSKIFHSRSFLSTFLSNFLYQFHYKLRLYIINSAHTPKVAYRQKIHFNHQKLCVPLQIRKKQVKEDKKQIIKIVCKNTHKKYSQQILLNINYFDQKIDQLYYHERYANLNSAQFIFINFLKNMNIFIEKFENKEFDSNGGLKEMKIISGRTIYLARKYNKKQFINLDSEKFSINRLTRIWKGYSEKIFRLFLEGKAMNKLFSQIEDSGFSNVYSVQKLQSQIDKIIQGITKDMKTRSVRVFLVKKLVFKNLQEQQLFTKLKKYKQKEVNEVYSSNNRQQPVKFRGNKSVFQMTRFKQHSMALKQQKSQAI